VQQASSGGLWRGSDFPAQMHTGRKIGKIRQICGFSLQYQTLNRAGFVSINLSGGINQKDWPA
jgi:hypothetical protein